MRQISAFWLRSCPHCSGDLYVAPQIDGYEVKCLLCSRVVADVIRGGNGVQRRYRAVDESEIEEDLALAG